MGLFPLNPTPFDKLTTPLSLGGEREIRGVIFPRCPLVMNEVHPIRQEGAAGWGERGRGNEKLWRRISHCLK